MKPSNLVEALLTAVPQNVPLHIWGACGVGKSQLVSKHPVMAVWTCG